MTAQTIYPGAAGLPAAAAPSEEALCTSLRPNLRVPRLRGRLASSRIGRPSYRTTWTSDGWLSAPLHAGLVVVALPGAVSA